MKHLLILYASTEGQTKKIAHRMAESAETTSTRVSVTDLTDDDAPDLLDTSDAVIIGASVHVGTHQKEAVQFVKTYRSRLEQIPSGFFSVSMAKASPGGEGLQQAKEYADQFLKETGWHPDQVDTFAGALTYQQYGLIKRFIMNMISRSAGLDTDTKRDHEYTDWQAVDRYAREFTSSLS